MGTGMEGADVDGLERAGRRCLDGAELAGNVRQVMEGIVAALSAVSFFAGPWVAPIIAFLTTTVIPWLRNVETALRNFGNVLNGRAAAQRRISDGLSVDFAKLPRYTGLTPVAAVDTSDPGNEPRREPVADPPSPPRPIPPPFEPSPVEARPAVAAPGPRLRSSAGSYAPAAPTIDPMQPLTAPPLAPIIPPDPQPVKAVPATGRDGISPAVAAGVGLIGGGMAGGAATYAAIRRRDKESDGSELLGPSTADGEAPDARRPGTLTAADVSAGDLTAADPSGEDSDPSRAEPPAAEHHGRRSGANS